MRSMLSPFILAIATARVPEAGAVISSLGGVAKPVEKTASERKGGNYCWDCPLERPRFRWVCKDVLERDREWESRGTWDGLVDLDAQQAAGGGEADAGHRRHVEPGGGGDGHLMRDATQRGERSIITKAGWEEGRLLLPLCCYASVRWALCWCSARS